MGFHCVDEVLAACGHEAALSSNPGRKRRLVESHHHDQRLRRNVSQCSGVHESAGFSVFLIRRSNSFIIDFCSFSKVNSPPTRGTIMQSHPAGISGRNRRNASLQSRLMRFRCTAFPWRLDTATPTRVGASGWSGRFCTTSIIRLSATRTPSAKSREISLLLLSRIALPAGYRFIALPELRIVPNTKTTVL